ncbi:hypothetical protein MW887_009762 [Aspergillus wentii]|nr:hypothetical protein MW887_009762 [Aspergillus wentii]
MPKKIECYLDCVSPYSYHAFTYLQKNAASLKALNVEIEYIPVFLGGINVGSETLETAFLNCFETMWLGQLDLSKPENLVLALGKSLEKHQVEEILTAAADPQIKGLLAATTERVIKEQGAFGCPWFWVDNGEGVKEPFFGSDRFHYMWEFLGLPYEDLRLNVKASL